VSVVCAGKLRRSIPSAFRRLNPLKIYLDQASPLPTRGRGILPPRGVVALSRRDRTLRETRIHFNEWRAARGKPALPPRREPYTDHRSSTADRAALGLHTGLRRSELGHLREDIYFEAKWLTVSGVSAKNGQARRIPLSAQAL
jgi:integrase